jgi:hypothetical protein
VYIRLPQGMAAELSLRAFLSSSCTCAATPSPGRAGLPAPFDAPGSLRLVDVAPFITRSHVRSGWIPLPDVVREQIGPDQPGRPNGFITHASGPLAYLYF